MTRALLAGLLLLWAAAPAFAQDPGRFSFSAGIGPGIQLRSNSYTGDVQMGVRLGVAVGVARGVAFEAGAEKTWRGPEYGDDLLLSPDGSSPALGYLHWGGNLSAVLTRIGGLRFSAGAGVYRVSPDGGSANIYTGEPWSKLTRGTLHAAIELSILHVKRVGLYGGLRAIYFPNLRDESALYLPLELGLRFL